MKPAPKPCASMSKASRVLPAGSLPASLVSRRSPKNGVSRTIITASEAIASGHGRACTIWLQRRHFERLTAPPPLPSETSPVAGAAARVRRARSPHRRCPDLLSTRGPTRESIAGSSVIEAASVSRTASTEAMASPYMKLTPVANMPSRAITTVVPASRIARPEVSIASSTDPSMSPLRR